MEKRIKVLDFLRGFAALVVVIFHFGDTILFTIKPNLLSNILPYGQFGVLVFFVISGFVIPYSMAKSNYVFSDFLKILLGRFIRISPPAYFSLLLTFIFYYSCILILGKPINGSSWWPGINFNSLIGNFTFITPYINTTWFNPVFWTLTIEFQFYIIIGLLLPIIMTQKVKNIVLPLLLLQIIGFIDFLWFFRYASFFVLGIILFLIKEKLISKAYIILLTVCTLLICFYQNVLPANLNLYIYAPFMFSIITFSIILLGFNPDFKLTNHLGKISYSLYVTHYPVGQVAEIAFKRITSVHETQGGKILMLFIYVIIAIIFASIFYKLVEKPFIIYSKKIRQKK